MDYRVLTYRAFIAMLALSGCAGARGSVAFNKLEYPVSMSSYVEDRSGRVLSPNDMQVIGELKYETKVWGMGYSIIPLSGEKDVSAPINEQVRSARGEGVSDLSVAADYCALNHVPVLNFLPVWPTCVDVSIRGNIIRGKPAPALPREESKPVMGAPAPESGLSGSGLGPASGPYRQRPNTPSPAPAPARPES